MQIIWKSPGLSWGGTIKEQLPSPVRPRGLVGETRLSKTLSAEALYSKHHDGPPLESIKLSPMQAALAETTWLLQRGYHSWQSRAGTLLLATLGQGNVMTLHWRGRRLTKRRHRSSPGGYCASCYLSAWKQSLWLLEKERKSLPTCYRNCLKD